MSDQALIAPLASLPLAVGVVLGTSTAVLYTAPGAPNAVVHIRGIKFCNRGAVSRIIAIYHVPKGSSATANFVWLQSVPVPALTTDEMSWGQGEFVLKSGDTLQGVSDAAGAVNVFIYGQVQE